MSSELPGRVSMTDQLSINRETRHDADTLAGELGGWLADSRLQIGLSVADLSGLLRIQQFYLEALEKEDFGSLPARPYVSGYVRSYALKVGLDPREANRRLQAAWPHEELPELPGKAATAFQDPSPERRPLRGGLVAASVIAAGAAYAIWYFTEVQHRAEADLTPVAGSEAGARTGGQDVAVVDRPGVRHEAPPVVLGPLAPVDITQKPDGYLAQYSIAADQPSSRQIADQKKPVPAGAFPRPRPQTPAAEQFAAIYEAPLLTTLDEPASGAEQRASDDGTTLARAAPQDGGLGAYLPKLHLRADLGPLDSNLPPVAPQASFETATAPIVETEPELRQNRTQAFAAVPSLVGDRPGGAEPILAPNEILLAASGGASWVEVRDSDGRPVLSKLLEDGEAVSLALKKGMTLTTGNAAALVVTIAGRQMPAIDARGKVVRGVRLNPALWPGRTR